MQLWKENEKRWNQNFMHQTGVLWMVTAGDDHFERESLPLLRDAGIPYQELSVQEMAARWPQINLEAVHWGIYEPEGGYLTARVACQAVLDGFLAEGGEYQAGGSRFPRDLDGGKLGQACRFPMARSSRPISTSSPAGRGWENCFLKPSAIASARPSRTYFSLALPPEINRFTDDKPAGLGRSSRPFHLWHSRQSRPRIQNRRRYARPGIRSDIGRTNRQPGRSARSSANTCLPLPCVERCSAARVSRLPVRE